MSIIDPKSGSIILVRQHHRNNHDRQNMEEIAYRSDYSNPNSGQTMYHNDSTSQTSSSASRPYVGNRHSTENIYYADEYSDMVHTVNGERRHSVSSDYVSEYGYNYQRNGGNRRASENDRINDRNSLKQTWFDNIRDRYQSANRTSKKDITFPKSLENYRTKYSEIKNTIIRSGSKLWEEADKRRLTERRKKTVRFDGGHDPDSSIDDGWMTLSNMDRWDTLRQGSQDSGTKDSGIETSSNFTSSEDSNRGDFKV